VAGQDHHPALLNRHDRAHGDVHVSLVLYGHGVEHGRGATFWVPLSHLP